MNRTLLAIAIATLLAACSGRGSTTDRADAVADTVATRDTLLIGVLPTLDCLPLYVAHDAGLLDSLALHVALVPFDNSLDCDAALMTGAIDGCVTDLVRGEWMREHGTAIEYVTATDTYWLLVANRKSRIKSMRQLKDKMIATTRHSAAAMLADAAADSSKTEPDYVFRIQINDPALRLRMLTNNEMDGAVLSEPQAVAARQAGHPVLKDSRELGWQMGVVAFTTDGLRRAGSAATMAAVYDAAIHLINNNGVRAYADIMKQHMKVDDGTVAALVTMETAARTAGSPGLFGTSRPPRDSDIETAKGYVRRSQATN